MPVKIFHKFIWIFTQLRSIGDIRSESELVYRSGENTMPFPFFTTKVMKMMNCALSLWIYFLCLCAILDWPWQCEGSLHVTQRKLHRKNAVVFCAGWRKVWHDKMTEPIFASNGHKWIVGKTQLSASVYTVRVCGGEHYMCVSVKVYNCNSMLKHR